MNLHQHDFSMAIRHIDQVLAQPEENAKAKKEYGSLALSLGALIHNNGLCQTIAFVKSKAKTTELGPNADQIALDHLTAILGRREQNDLLAYVGGLSTVAYLHATERVQAAWVYHKRFAESVLGATKGEETTP